ncbi:hypothetical protein ACFX19_043539 [Malus domestica]
MEHRGGRRTKSGRRTRRKEEGGPVLSLSLSSHGTPRRKEGEEGKEDEEERGRRTQRTPSAYTDAAHQPYVTQPSGSRAGNPRRACRSGPFSSPVPRATSNAGSPSPSRRALSPCLSPEQPATLELLSRRHAFPSLTNPSSESSSLSPLG